MGLSQLGESLDESEVQHTPLQRRPQRRSTSEDLEQNSSDSHEQYHPLHPESAENVSAMEDCELHFSAEKVQRIDLPRSISQYTRAISDLKRQIQLLEKNLEPVRRSEQNSRLVDSISTKVVQQNDQSPDEHSIQTRVDTPQILPRICERAWVDFMNKHTTEQYDYAIEVLSGDPEYYYHKKDTKGYDWRQGNGRSLRPESNNYNKSTASQPVDRMTPVPERIRINSPWILHVLAGIDQQIDATGPIVMLRPFKFLMHFEAQIKDSIRKLESQCDATTETMSQDGIELSLISQLGSTVSNNSAPTQHSDNNRLTLQHMRCLSQFMNEYIKPTATLLKDNTNEKIRFSDLWYIFRPGDNIYIPLRLPWGPVLVDAVKITPEMIQSRYDQSRYETTWRVSSTGGGRPNLSSAQDRNASLEPNPFKVNCYYIDFNGRYFCPISHTFSIMPFKGEREITSLEFFPVRFMKESERIMREHFEKGKMVFDCIATSFTHNYYVGPTLVAQPCGCSVQQENHETLHQEHVESEVIVDFRMTLIKQPSWRPKPSFKKIPVERKELEEHCIVRYWKDTQKEKLDHTESENIYDDYVIDEERAATFMNNEQIFAPVPSDCLSNEGRVPEKDMVLMPARVFAFVLRTRTFAPLWLWLLQPIRPQLEGLRNLQLRDDSFKDTMQALIRNHFSVKAEPKMNSEYDIVRGKGKGLVILLHGAPGVGKTFTAESVAAANGKPLFQITCGDLGLTPREVEKSLQEIFRFAQQWSCILLLDECDIFLTQRSKTDIKRNSLVSVFLRVLEFYHGVLFLCTNRVGVLDDAIKSRITWIAYYPPLDKNQTMKIWKANLKLLGERNKDLQVDRKGILGFAKEHFKSNAANDSVWNGRQIQNAFKVASALAEWDAYSDDLRQNADIMISEEENRNHAKLDASHFHTIAEGTQAFNSYLLEATGHTEAERAYNAMERADEYTPDWNIHRSGNVATPQQFDRQRSPSSASPAPPPLTLKSRSSGSAGLTSSLSQAHGEPSPYSHSQTASRRRTSSVSNTWQNQTPPAYNINSLSPPPTAQQLQSQSRRRSSSLLTTKGASGLESLNTKSPSPRNSISKSSHVASHTQPLSSVPAASARKMHSSFSSKARKRPSLDVSPDTAVTGRGLHDDQDQSHDSGTTTDSSGPGGKNVGDGGMLSDSEDDDEDEDEDEDEKI